MRSRCCPRLAGASRIRRALSLAGKRPVREPRTPDAGPREARREPRPNTARTAEETALPQARIGQRAPAARGRIGRSLNRRHRTAPDAVGEGHPGDSSDQAETHGRRACPPYDPGSALGQPWHASPTSGPCRPGLPVRRRRPLSWRSAWPAASCRGGGRRDSYSAAIMTGRLMAADRTARRRPLPESVAPPDGTWTRSTAQHLAHWAIFMSLIEPGKEPSPRGSRGALVPSTRRSRRSIRRRGWRWHSSSRPQTARTISPRGLGLSRDAASLSWCARRLLAAGNKEDALKMYKQGARGVDA